MITDSQGYLDLVSNDYYLFPKLKEFDGKIFGFNNEIIAQKDAHFEDLMKSHYLERLEEMEKRWRRCMELKENYVQ